MATVHLHQTDSASLPGARRHHGSPAGKHSLPEVTWGGAARCKWDPPIGLSADCDALKVSASQSGCWLGWATSSPEGSLS